MTPTTIYNKVMEVAIVLLGVIDVLVMHLLAIL